MSTTPQSPSFRFPNNVGDNDAHPNVVKGMRDTFKSLTDIYQAIPNLKAQIDAHSTAITTIQNTTSSGGGSGPIPPPTPFQFPNLGSVNNQTGVTVYTLQPTDAGAIIDLSDTSAIAVTLNSFLSTPFFTFVNNLGVGIATFTPSSGTVNGVGSISLRQNQSALFAFDGTNWFALIASFGTVTHTTTALTSGEFILGNGGNDVALAPLDYGVSTAGLITSTVPVNIMVSTVGNLAFEITNSAAGGVAWIATASAGTGNQWGMEVTGTTAAPFRGALFADNTAGVINLLLSSVSSKAVAALTSTGMFGWYAGASPVTSTTDTGLSRSAAATLVVGNGTPGDASGTVRAANVHATSAASGTINLAALTIGGTTGSITVVDGIITAFVNPT